MAPYACRSVSVARRRSLPRMGGERSDGAVVRRIARRVGGVLVGSVAAAIDLLALAQVGGFRHCLREQTQSKSRSAGKQRPIADERRRRTSEKRGVVDKKRSFVHGHRCMAHEK